MATRSSSPNAPDERLASFENVTTDAVLWYNVGIFGEQGYGIPNPSNDIGTLNPQIADVTNMMGLALFALMHHEDVDMSTPPSINTLTRAHQLYVRANQILYGRAIPDNEPRLETDHVTPAGAVFKVWPVPYFRVRNRFMYSFAHWTMVAISECFQSTENRNTIEISVRFADMVGKYLKRMYVQMAVELFGKTREAAQAPGFLLTPQDFQAYDPASFFTSIELVDPVPSLDLVLSEDRLAVLRSGIAITELPTLQPYPGNLQNIYEAMRAARADTTNPDTGVAMDDRSTITGAAVFPSGASFVRW